MLFLLSFFLKKIQHYTIVFHFHFMFHGFCNKFNFEQYQDVITNYPTCLHSLRLCSYTSQKRILYYSLSFFFLLFGNPMKMECFANILQRKRTRWGWQKEKTDGVRAMPLMPDNRNDGRSRRLQITFTVLCESFKNMKIRDLQHTRIYILDS